MQPHRHFTDGIVVNNDCIQALDELDDNSIDLIFTSPPYFQGKDFDTSAHATDFLHHISIAQQKLYPKLKYGGSLCWQIGTHVHNRVVIPLDFYIYSICNAYPDLALRNRIIWTFGHGEHARRRFSGRHETVLWFTKGDNYYFDLDSIRIPQKYPGKRSYRGPNRGNWSGNPLGKNPGDVWSIPNVKANLVEKTAHPCQFPVALVSRFIRALTSLGATVLDPYSGSGSTAIAALETGRRFYCIEIDSQYVEISHQRILEWYDGSAKVRPDVPVIVPASTTAVTTTPPHFHHGDSK